MDETRWTRRRRDSGAMRAARPCGDRGVTVGACDAGNSLPCSFGPVSHCCIVLFYMTGGYLRLLLNLGRAMWLLGGNGHGPRDQAQPPRVFRGPDCPSRSTDGHWMGREGRPGPSGVWAARETPQRFGDVMAKSPSIAPPAHAVCVTPDPRQSHAAFPAALAPSFAMDGSVPGAAPKPRPAKTRTAPGGGGGGAVPADGQRAASLPPLALNGVGGPGGLAPLEPQWVINDAAAALGLQHFARAHLDGLHGLNHGMPLPLGVQDGGLQGGGAPGPSGTPRQPKDAAAKKAAKADAKGDKPKKEKRKKVTQACVYCRRSHMTCDVGRPCQRCVKRNIAHLCHDDNKQAGADGQSVRSTSPELVSPSDHGLMSASGSGNHLLGFDATTAAQVLGPLLSSTHPLTTESGQLHEFGDHDHALANLDSYGLGSLAAFPPLFAAEHSGHEFSILSDFLSSLDDGGHFRDLVGSQSHPILLSSTHDAGGLLNGGPSHGGSGAPPTPHQPSLQPPPQISTPSSDGLARDKTERFILTAADPDDNADAQEDRLTRVIHAKFEAGLLKPYNYHNGYVRLQNYMENHVEPASRNRILSVISAIRPAFRSVGQSLTDLDLVLVEEHFERLLLEYDRVFTSVGVPACLWRRTGEIWKSNREFANLVQLPMERLSMGRTCIYELMQEDSAVNYWEKYGNIAFDEGQKAVLTSCVLKNPDGNPMGHPGLLAGNATELFASDLATAERERRASISGPPGKRGSSSAVMPAPSGRKTVPCCFSFTIRRDRYGMPILITGNFLPSVQEY